LHPGSRILIYILTALVIPGLSFFLMGILLLAALGGVAWLGRDPLRLILRTRWLLIILILGYGFSVPGVAVWTWWGEWTPTWSGLALGTEHALQLMVLLMWLDVLVLSLSAEQMLSGIHGLMKPFAWLGVDARRIALRLALTLKAIERLEGRGYGQVLARGTGTSRSNLRRLLDPLPSQTGPEIVVLHHNPVRARDILIPLLLLLGFGLVAWAGGWN
jgi:energy-coupling factor transporter transmembrane protein EcfT